MSLRRIFVFLLACALLWALPCAAAEEPRYYMGDVPLNAAADSGFTGTNNDNIIKSRHSVSTSRLK